MADDTARRERECHLACEAIMRELAVLEGAPQRARSAMLAREVHAAADACARPVETLQRLWDVVPDDAHRRVLAFHETTIDSDIMRGVLAYYAAALRADVRRNVPLATWWRLASAAWAHRTQLRASAMLSRLRLRAHWHRTSDS